MNTRPFFVLGMALAAGAVGAKAGSTYGDDVAFLKQHTPVIELVAGQARVAIAPAFQGRVMTSTAAGPRGQSFGWINRELVAAGIKPEAERAGAEKHMHAFGGEERLWFGPEGGPFALFFPPEVPQTYEHWKTPAVMDTEAFETTGPPSATGVAFAKQATLPNRAGAVLRLGIGRDVRLVDAPGLAAACAGPLPEGVQAVGYQTRNTVRNMGDKAWTKETGAPSIWLLGMFTPTPRTTIVIPMRKSDAGPPANTNYAGFGPIPPDRVKTTATTLFFKGDGKSRGKLGIPPQRAAGIAGSWQADAGVLTLVRIVPSADKAAAGWPYVDSQWKDEGDPYAGDVINAYNDGPATPGAKPLGPFYELETSGPAMLLAAGASFTHAQTTVHLTGLRPALDAIARRTLGVGLDEVEQALP